jgi:hypothetical protein
VGNLVDKEAADWFAAGGFLPGTFRMADYDRLWQQLVHDAAVNYRRRRGAYRTVDCGGFALRIVPVWEEQ